LRIVERPNSQGQEAARNLFVDLTSVISQCWVYDVDRSTTLLAAQWAALKAAVDTDPDTIGISVFLA
jgi:hypothetical protein